MRLLLCSLLLLLGPAWGQDAPVLQAGFADRDISPEIGMERPGGYGKSFHKSFHDACKARAAVFEQEGKAVALVGLDALIIREPSVERVRKAIEEATGISQDSVLIGASHSHSSGPTGMVLPGEFDEADSWIQELAYERSSMADPAYLQIMEQGIIDAVTEAFEKRVPVQAGFGSGHDEQVSFNRRFYMENGLTFTHPRYGNPEMLQPAGPIDGEVGVIGAWNAEGKLLGCVVNFACHATTSPPGISANYIYYVEQAVRGMMGEEAVVVFLNGASGDVTQVDNQSPIRRPTGEEAAMKLGGRVGAEAVKVMLAMDVKTSQAKIASKTEILEIPRRKPGPARLAHAKELAGQDPTPETNLTDWTFAKEILLLDAMIAQEPVRDVEIQAIQVGPAVFLTTPAEYFCQFGLYQKAQSQFPFTWPVSLANGCVGYVPTFDAFSANGGGYETRLTSYSNLVPGAGDLMAETGVKLANSLQPDHLPEGEPSPEFKEAWSYGSVAPQVE